MGFRFDPYDPAFDADPFPAYKVLRDEYPCFWSEEAGMWVLSRYDDILGALTNWKTYSSAKGNLIDEFPGRAGSTLGSSDPPRHDRLRALIQSAMTKRALDHILEPARASVAQHLAEIGEGDTFDFVTDFGGKITVDLLFYLFNLPREGAELVRDNAVLMVQTDAKTRQKSAEHLAAFQWMANYAEGLVQERKANPGDDLLSNFITAEIDGEKLLDKEVQLTVTTLIMAGIESHVCAQPGRHARCAPDIGGRPVADPRRDRGIAAVQHLRAAFQAVPASRYRTARADDEGRRFRHARLWLGQPRRAHVRRCRHL